MPENTILPDETNQEQKVLPESWLLFPGKQDNFHIYV